MYAHQLTHNPLLPLNSSSKGRSESPSIDLAFERHVDKVLARLHERLIGLRDPASRHGEILMAKHGLYDMAFQELITIFDQRGSPSGHVQGDDEGDYKGDSNGGTKGGDKGSHGSIDHKGIETGGGLTAQILRSLSLVHTELLEAMHSLLIASTNERTMETTRLASKVEAMEQNEAQVLRAAEVLGREAGATDQDLILLREENRRLRETVSEMRERHRADGLELQQLRRDVVDIAASGSSGLWANASSVPATPAPAPSLVASERGVPPPATPAGLAPGTPQTPVTNEGSANVANVASDGIGHDPKPEPEPKAKAETETDFQMEAEVNVEAPIVRKLTLVQLKVMYCRYGPAKPNLNLNPNSKPNFQPRSTSTKFTRGRPRNTALRMTRQTTRARARATTNHSRSKCTPI